MLLNFLPPKCSLKAMFVPVKPNIMEPIRMKHPSSCSFSGKINENNLKDPGFAPPPGKHLIPYVIKLFTATI